MKYGLVVPLCSPEEALRAQTLCFHCGRSTRKKQFYVFSKLEQTIYIQKKLQKKNSPNCPSCPSKTQRSSLSLNPKCKYSGLFSANKLCKYIFKELHNTEGKGKINDTIQSDWPLYD